jgi:hypothetical protein
MKPFVFGGHKRNLCYDKVRERYICHATILLGESAKHHKSQTSIFNRACFYFFTSCFRIPPNLLAAVGTIDKLGEENHASLYVCLLLSVAVAGLRFANAAAAVACANSCNTTHCLADAVAVTHAITNFNRASHVTTNANSNCCANARAHDCRCQRLEPNHGNQRGPESAL